MEELDRYACSDERVERYRLLVVVDLAVVRLVVEVAAVLWEQMVRLRNSQASMMSTR